MIKYNLLAACCLLFFVVLYFVQTNGIIENNFKLSAFQKKIKAEQEKNQSLQMAILQVHSLKGLGEKAKEMRLVSINEAEYLKGLPEYFAMAKSR